MTDKTITTLRKLISKELLRRGETWQDVEACTCTDADLDVEFDEDRAWHWQETESGTPWDWEAKPFYLWTANFVYFSYEVRENDWADSPTPVYCASAPRHPGNIKPERFGHGYP